MNEADWFNSTDPQAMLAFLGESGLLSERRARLFAVACCRGIWHVLADERSRKAVDVAEACADGWIEHQEQDRVADAAYGALEAPSGGPAEAAALQAVRPWGREKPALAMRWVAHNTARAGGHYQERVKHTQVAWLRDIIGPLPFRPLPPLKRPVLAWNDGLVAKLATAIYEDRLLPSGHLDSARLAVLADALEEAGVTDPDILGHLRVTGAVHVRGCFVLDWLLAKS